MLEIPFTTEQFFQIFAEYNRTVFPIQLIFSILGLLCILAVTRNRSTWSNWIGYFLAGTWIWVGVVYHLIFFTKINLPAYGFGGLFILQGIFFLRETYQKRLQFFNHKSAANNIGIALVFFALLLYPLIAYFLKGELTKIISIGLPCPTTIMTFGFLLLSNKVPKYLLVLPTLWALIGTWAAIDFGVYQDYMMTLSAGLAFYFLILKKAE